MRKVYHLTGIFPQCYNFSVIMKSIKEKSPIERHSKKYLISILQKCPGCEMQEKTE